MDYYVVDAFAENVFSGNPAGVCIMERWPTATTMQAIAAENNLSETAFAVKSGHNYALRWFTPASEVDLCGHATLATAFVLANYYHQTARAFIFETQSGLLTVEKHGDLYEMNFPAFTLQSAAIAAETANKALGVEPLAAFLGPDLLLLLENEQAVSQVTPQYDVIQTLPGMGLIVTAPGVNCDFVSRFFAPKMGVPEDHVTGRAHCALIPFWAQKLGKSEMTARQLSKRGGTLYCRNLTQRVQIGGKAALYLKGSIGGF